MGYLLGFNPENPGGTFQHERHTAPFKAMCGPIGYVLKTTDQWVIWERLVNTYGYAKVTWALNRCEPKHRWASDVETMCRESARQQAMADKQAAQDAANTEMKEKAKAKGRLVNVDGKWVVQEVTL